MSSNEPILVNDYQWDFPPQVTDYTEIMNDRKIPGHIKMAYLFGLLKPGYSLQDYLVEAVTGPPDQPGRGGYETILIWAVQGSGKSTRGLQYLKWLYQDWETVLENIVFTPQEFIDLLEKVPDEETIPGLFWDDILVHYPASKFKTDIKMYEHVDSTFASIRTKANVILASLPIIDRTAKNVKDNATFEIFLGRNQMEAQFRLFRLPGMRRIESNFFKVQLSTFSKFDLYEVPIEIWRKYWTRRISLTKEALASLKSVVDMGDDPNYIPILEGARMYREATNKRKSVNTLQQMGSRGVIETKKVKGRLHVHIDDIQGLIDEDLAFKKQRAQEKRNQRKNE
jgi:hypothetical protein